MLKISKKQYEAVNKRGRLPKNLMDAGITIIMPKKAADEWLAALRSGEFKQIDSTMTDGNGRFCCLGVQQYCALDGYVEVDESNEYEPLPSLKYLKQEGIFFADRFGKRSNNPYLPQKLTDAAALNDEKSWNARGERRHTFTFKSIAKFLEAAIAVY